MKNLRIPEMVVESSPSKPALQKVLLDGRLALYFKGVYFYYPENEDWITIISDDQDNTISANSDINDTKFHHTRLMSRYKILPEKDYQKKYGKFDEKLGVYIG
jgi:hypothetical protein